ncbi:MAG: cytochrome c peroxidase [Candidatus Eiseniibacteriota bacterium]|jgi:cytochrome c peroxidase
MRVVALCTPLVLLALSLPASSSADLTPLETLGKMLFFDTNLSTPPGMSCAACHAPEWGFTGPIASINAAGSVYFGAVHVRSGNRKPPTAAYGGPSPVLSYDPAEDVWIGGMFWDGRATGWRLDDPLAEQAQGPFLNPLEQNNPNPRLVLIKVSQSSYADLFEEVWGPGSLDFVGDVDGSYERLARSISAYEQSDEVNPFTSKFDIARGEFTQEEEWGLQLFEDPMKGNCAACHPTTPGDFDPDHALFTDFTYDNLGLPKNPENPFYGMPPKWNPDGADWVDPGLGGFLAGTQYASQAPENYGKHKVPTLRNVGRKPAADDVKAYGHNGYFKTLTDIMHFYNTRDVEPWPDPEVSANVNYDELGDLGLTQEEEDAIVAFLLTLSDGYGMPEPMAPNPARSPSLATLTSIRAYPNPLRTDGFVEWQGASTALRLYDASGRLVLTRDVAGRGDGSHRIAWGDLVNHQALASGVYFLHMDGVPQAARRIVVTR